MEKSKIEHLFRRAIMLEGAEIPNGRYTLEVVIEDDDSCVFLLMDNQEKR